MKTKELANARFMELEGIRGLAAIAVVLYHAFVIFYPALFYGVGHPLAPVLHGKFENLIFGSPLGVFMSGVFAVSTFFVLSGFVLSIGFFQTKKYDIVQKLAIKRYIRLMLPALASVIVVFVILSLNLDYGKVEAEAITRSGASSTLWQFDPNFFEVFKQGTWQIFIRPLDASHYNPVLWTMQYEFLGSFLVFSFLLIFGMAKHRWIVYGILLIVSINTWYLGFIIGMIFADLYANHRKLISRFSKEKIKLVGWFFFGLGLVLGGYPLVDPSSGFYSFLYLNSIPIGANLINYTIIGASMIVFSVLAVPKLADMFKNPRISRLGKYTYSLYLTHLPILFVISTSVFVLLIKYVDYKLATLGAIAAAVPVIIVSTWLFEKYVDAPSIRLSGRFYKWFDNRRT